MTNERMQPLNDVYSGESMVGLAGNYAMLISNYFRFTHEKDRKSDAAYQVLVDIVRLRKSIPDIVRKSQTLDFFFSDLKRIEEECREHATYP